MSIIYIHYLHLSNITCKNSQECRSWFRWQHALFGFRNKHVIIISINVQENNYIFSLQDFLPLSLIPLVLFTCACLFFWHSSIHSQCNYTRQVEENNALGHSYAYNSQVSLVAHLQAIWTSADFVVFVHFWTSYWPDNESFLSLSGLHIVSNNLHPHNSFIKTNQVWSCSSHPPCPDQYTLVLRAWKS